MSLNILSANLDIQNLPHIFFYNWQNWTLQTKRETEKIICDPIMPFQSTCNHCPYPNFSSPLPMLCMFSPIPNQKCFCKSNFCRYTAYFSLPNPTWWESKNFKDLKLENSTGMYKIRLKGSVFFFHPFALEILFFLTPMVKGEDNVQDIKLTRVRPNTDVLNHITPLLCSHFLRAAHDNWQTHRVTKETHILRLYSTTTTILY